MGLISATTQYAVPYHERHYDTWSKGLICRFCGEPRSNTSKALCSDCANTWWLPKLRKWRAKKREWLEHFAKLQEGKIPPSCPSCGYSMRLWYGWWDAPGTEDVSWICRRKIGKFTCTMELPLEDAEAWRFEVALAAVIKKKPKKPIIVHPPLIDGVPMVKSVDLAKELRISRITIWQWYSKEIVKGAVLPAGGKRALYVCRADVVGHLDKRIKSKRRGRPFKMEREKE